MNITAEITNERPFSGYVEALIKLFSVYEALI